MPTFSSKFYRGPQNIPPSHKKNFPCIIHSFLKLVHEGNLHEAVASLEVLSRRGVRLPSKTLACLLWRCGEAKSLKLGKWVHLHLRLTGLKRPGTLLANHLMRMYFDCGDHGRACQVFNEMSERNLYTWNNLLAGFAKLGMVKQARKFFDKMPERDAVSWNTLVVAYSHSGSYGEGFRLYKEFRKSGIVRNEYSFGGLLMLCVKMRELGLVRQAHGQVFVGGFSLNVVISSTVVDAYVKCDEMMEAMRLFDDMNVRDVVAWTTLVSGYAQRGDVDEAVRLFDLMPEKSSVSWTSLISGYARHGMGNNALLLFKKMLVSRFRPDQYTFSSCLRACAITASLRHGKQLHGFLVKLNRRPNIIVISSLIDMYSKCGRLEVARRVFNLVCCDKQEAVLWNSMISALAQHGQGQEGIVLLYDMARSGVRPDRTTFDVLVNLCINLGIVDLEEGVELLEFLIRGYGIIPDQG